MSVKLGYQNLLESATLTASSEDTANNGHKENAVDGLRYDQWISTAGGTQTLDFDLGSNQSIDFLALYGLDLQGGQIGLQWGTTGAGPWTDIIAAFTPATDVVFKSFSTLSKRYLRLNITGAAAAVSVSDVCVGAMFTHAHGPQIGYVPPLAQPAKGGVNVSSQGYPLGSDYKLVPAPMKIKFDNLAEATVRSDFVPFFNHAKTGKRFFVSWDETNYPNEAAYCWCDPEKSVLPPYSNGTLMRYALNGYCLVVN